jgi:hypothetical protein
MQNLNEDTLGTHHPCVIPEPRPTETVTVDERESRDRLGNPEDPSSLDSPCRLQADIAIPRKEIIDEQRARKYGGTFQAFTI